jgi:hypothetical protein
MAIARLLFEHLNLLGAGDLLLMDLGYPCRWLVVWLNTRRIGSGMRVDNLGNAGFACSPGFLRSGLQEQLVTLAASREDDAWTVNVPPKRRPYTWYATSSQPGKCAS